MMRIFITMLVPIIIGTATWAQGDLSDPYEIYKEHFEAIGGFERGQAESTRYMESDIVYWGMPGTVKTWQKNPICERNEVDLKVFKQVSGDNCEVNWSVDANGKLIINRDEHTLKRRELRRLRSQFDYLDPKSSVFSLSFIGKEKVDNKDCYVIKMTNTINNDSSLIYFNTESFLMEQEISIESNNESHAIYSDYRAVGGILRAFHQDITNQPTGEQITVQLTKCESNIDIDPSLFDPPEIDVRDFEFTEGDKAENIPFEFLHDHIFLRVNVGGKERLWVLDTGAEMSVIDSSFAAELGLEQSGDIKGRGTANIISLSLVKLPPFSVKGVRFNEQTAISLDIKNIIFKRAGWDAVGILGYDFISRFLIKIDYAKKIISLYDPDNFVYDGEGKTVDMPFRDATPSIQASVDEKYTGIWEVDIGAGGCDFTYPYAKANGFLEKNGVYRMGIGAGGPSLDRTVQFDSFDLAGFIIKKPIIGFPAEAVTGAFGTDEIVGNLGNSVLRHFTVYFDYKNQKMIIEKGDDFDKEFPTSKSGLQIFYNEANQMEVFYVAENTPAAEAGFKIGDIVLTINGIRTENLNGLEAVRELMQADAGTRYSFTIVRDKEQKKLQLTLRDLFN